MFTEQAKPLMEYHDKSPIPIEYISFAGFNSNVQFFYDCGPNDMVEQICTYTCSPSSWFFCIKLYKIMRSSSMVTKADENELENKY